MTAERSFPAEPERQPLALQAIKKKLRALREVDHFSQLFDEQSVLSAQLADFKLLVRLAVVAHKFQAEDAEWQQKVASSYQRILVECEQAEPTYDSISTEFNLKAEYCAYLASVARFTESLTQIHVLPDGYEERVNQLPLPLKSSDHLRREVLKTEFYRVQDRLMGEQLAKLVDAGQLADARQLSEDIDLLSWGEPYFWALHRYFQSRFDAAGLEDLDRDLSWLIEYGLQNQRADGLINTIRYLQEEVKKSIELMIPNEGKYALEAEQIDLIPDFDDRLEAQVEFVETLLDAEDYDQAKFRAAQILDELETVSQEVQGEDYSFSLVNSGLDDQGNYIFFRLREEIRLAQILVKYLGDSPLVHECLLRSSQEHNSVWERLENAGCEMDIDLIVTLMKIYTQMGDIVQVQALYLEAQKALPDLDQALLLSYLKCLFELDSTQVLPRIMEVESLPFRADLLGWYAMAVIMDQETTTNWQTVARTFLELEDEIQTIEENSLFDQLMSAEPETENDDFDAELTQQEREDLEELGPSDSFELDDSDYPYSRQGHILLMQVAKLALERGEQQVFAEILDHHELSTANKALLLTEAAEWFVDHKPFSYDFTG